MKQWMKKLSAIFITVLTLGMYIPPAILPTNAETKGNPASKSDYDDLYVENTTKVEENIDVDIQLPSIEDTYTLEIETIVKAITDQAKEQTLTKFGPKITNQVETEFTMAILPIMEEVITDLLAQKEDELLFLGVTENPTKGYGEKIFNIYDYRTNKDIARFDVRRDNRPQDGYWFNFHYHLSDDNFETHHEIGEIYWDKNTPPKWMS